MLISHCTFLFLDSTKAPLNDSLLKRLCIYSIPGLGATPVFIFSLKQAVLAPIPFSLSRLSSDWLSVTKNNVVTTHLKKKKSRSVKLLCATWIHLSNRHSQTDPLL